MNVNYVKFIRGSSDAFNNLAVKDSNTLYFITEGDILKLYLGSVLIGSSSIEVSEPSSLEDLSNVSISDILSQHDILRYDGENWVNTSLKDYKDLLAIPSIEDMEGATNTVDDTPGKDGKSGLVPAPKAGEADFFLKGDGKWTNLSPVIAGEIDKLLANAPEALDTLQEIVDWISDPNNIEPDALIKRVGNLEEKIGNLNEIPADKTVVSMVNSHEEVLGQLGDNYLSISDFETRVGKLDNENAKLTKLKTENKNSLTEAINELYDQLIWGEINIES